MRTIFYDNFILLFQNRMVHHIPSSPLSQQSKSKEKPQLWKMTCLRPAPPSRSSLNQNEATPGSSNKRNSINAKPSARKGNFTHYLTQPTFFNQITSKKLSLCSWEITKKILRWKGLKIFHFLTLSIWKFGIFDKCLQGCDEVKNSMGPLQGPRLMTGITKSPIWGNQWVHLGCRALLGSVKVISDV